MISFKNENEEEDICTSPKLNEEEKKVSSFCLDSLPMTCLVEILSFVDSEIHSLSHRNISKKFNEAIQILLFMVIFEIINYIIQFYILQKTSHQKDSEFYKKFFIILNENCRKYFNNNIFPFLLDADSIYEFLSSKNEKIYKEFFAHCYKEINTLRESNGLVLKEKNFEKSFKRTVNKFLAKEIISNLKKENINSLVFDKLVPYNESFEILTYIVEEMKNLEYLDLSRSIFQEEKILSKLLEKVFDKEKKFVLRLEGIFISKEILKEIKFFSENKNIEIIIDKRFNGQMNGLGSKKMKIHKEGIKKQKYKGNRHRDIDFNG